MFQEKVVFFWVLLANWVLVIGIKLESVFIPQYAVKDATVTLRCDFDVESDKLMSLKWYKDDHEFFRYSMHHGIRMQTFSVEGVIVDTAQSTLNSVILKNVTLKTSGTYKCEVSADVPSFRTLSKQGDIIVIAPPKSNPRIVGFHSVVSLGDTLRGNCTCDRSRPAASLMFYINDEKADFGDLIEYLPISEQDGLETSVLGLRFQVEPKHFRSGNLELKCTATIGNGYWVTNMMVSQASFNAQPSFPGHNRLLAGSGSGHKAGDVGTWGTSLLATVIITLLGYF
ncbi:unnamed protein product [Orchesella dallaii]|uniref:Ig-like domain-containing protein n=1 Tax=Orchesella dallaii TaxID=48710 RepID=A0ABP1QC17_9HEXA